MLTFTLEGSPLCMSGVENFSSNESPGDLAAQLKRTAMQVKEPCRGKPAGVAMGTRANARKPPKIHRPHHLHAIWRDWRSGTQKPDRGE